LRIKEQEKRLTRNELDDDDDEEKVLLKWKYSVPNVATFLDDST
jgi:hypothetical protein